MFGIAVPLLLIAIGVTAWFVLARRDADFVTVGPKTKGVRDNFAKLDSMIDPADFRDCKTVRQAFTRLSEKMQTADPFANPDEKQFLIRWWPSRDWIRFDSDSIEAIRSKRDLLAAPFELPTETAPMTVKQFLRMAMAQTSVPNVNFVVRGHYVEVTTSKRAAEERARYLDGVSAADRMRNLWKELTGDLADDAPEFFEITVW